MKKTKEEKKNIRAERRATFKNEVAEGFGYLKENRNDVLAWVAIYVVPALLSLFFTKWTIAEKADFPLIIVNIVTRTLSLMVLTLYGVCTKFRKTLFAFGLTIWSVWMILLSDVPTAVAVIAGAVGLAAVIAFSFREKKKDGAIQPKNELRQFVIYFYVLFALTLLLETINCMRFKEPMLNLEAGVVKFILQPDVIMNCFMILIITGLFVLITRRKLFSFVLFTAIWLTFAIISVNKINNVYEPFMLLDIFATLDLAAVLTKYFKWYVLILLAIAVVGVVIFLVFLAKKEKPKHVPGSRVAAVLSAILIMIISFAATTNLSYAKFKSSYNIENYYEQGFTAAFTRYLLKSVPKKPAETEQINLESIKKNIDAKENVPPTIQNVIVVQMESYVDPTIFKNYTEVEYEHDPVPFLHSLEKEYSTGKVSVPVFAGQTIKSEFEFITGVNLDLLPRGYNPYVTSLNTTSVNSFARFMRTNGYDTTAIHNYQGEFFSRFQVYENLGFNRYIPVECMPGAGRRDSVIWSNDNGLVKQIEKTLDYNGDAPNFVFTVTVQLHGSYNPIPEDEFSMEIKGLENDPETRGKLGYYVKEIEGFDKAMSELIAMLEERDEPTVVLFYADHLPRVATDVCKLSDEETFTTCYYMWDNIGLPRTTDDYELYELSTMLCGKLETSGDFVNKFHREFGDAAKYTEEEYLAAQEIVGYDLTFEDTGYENEDYRIGFSDPELSDVREIEPLSAKNNVYTIYGSGLTDNAVITVNGKMFDIEFEDEHKATFNMGRKTLAQGDVLTIRIIGERKGTVFCESKEYIFGE